jgi:hypothetical protein
MLLLPGRQTGETWEPSKKQRSSPDPGTLYRKVILLVLGFEGLKECVKGFDSTLKECVKGFDSTILCHR